MKPPTYPVDVPQALAGGYGGEQHGHHWRRCWRHVNCRKLRSHGTPAVVLGDTICRTWTCLLHISSGVIFTAKAGTNGKRPTVGRIGFTDNRTYSTVIRSRWCVHLLRDAFFFSDIHAEPQVCSCPPQLLHIAKNIILNKYPFPLADTPHKPTGMAKSKDKPSKKQPSKEQPSKPTKSNVDGSALSLTASSQAIDPSLASLFVSSVSGTHRRQNILY